MNDPRMLHLSPLERKFFKLYADAAKRDYHVIQTAVALMNPDELGIICPTHATHVADGIQELYLEFDEALNRLTSKHRFTRRTVGNTPNPDDMVGLITASFFKLVAVVKTDTADFNNVKDGGWFSGETEDWQKNLAALKKSLAPLDNPPPVSPLVAAMVQLFNALINKKLPYQMYYQSPQSQSEEEEWEEPDDDNSSPEDFD
jgi:hypothetical protein